MIYCRFTWWDIVRFMWEDVKDFFSRNRDYKMSDVRFLVYSLRNAGVDVPDSVRTAADFHRFCKATWGKTTTKESRDGSIAT